MEFRHHKPSDSSAIERLFVRVFTASEGAAEGARIGELARNLMASTDREDLHGFVAVDEDQIVGAIFFSRLTFEEDVDAFILAPVAVDGAHQGQGVGQALIAHGLREMRKRGVAFVTTYGDPNFYAKVGFHPLSQDRVAAPFELSQPEGWLGQALTVQAIETIPGRCSCVAALNDPAYW
jgi:predicted N-acetyltransferase YhbS